MQASALPARICTRVSGAICSRTNVPCTRSLTSPIANVITQPMIPQTTPCGNVTSNPLVGPLPLAGDGRLRDQERLPTRLPPRAPGSRGRAKERVELAEKALSGAAGLVLVDRTKLASALPTILRERVRIVEQLLEIGHRVLHQQPFDHRRFGLASRVVANLDLARLTVEHPRRCLRRTPA